MNDCCSRLLSLVVLFTGFFVGEAVSQTAMEFPSKNHLVSKRSFCYQLKSGIVTKAELEKAQEDSRCKIAKLVDIDFAEQTLIFWQVGGDCNLKASIKGISRSSAEKVVTVEIDNVWGGCRAGGRAEGFLTVDKIPDDFRLEFIENLIDDRNYRNPGILRSEFETEQVDLKDCIQMFRSEEFLIRSPEDYLKLIRKDAQMESCAKLVESLDFEKYSYAGVLVRSGYCRVPLGLKHWGERDLKAGKVTISVRYTKPVGTCRAISRYELWLRVPRMTKDQKLEFDIQTESPVGS